MIQRDLKRYARHLKGYTELRLQENTVTSVVSLDGRITTNSRTTSGGFSARVYEGSSWGFASFPEKDHAAALKVLALARDNAGFLAARSKRKPALTRMRGAVGAYGLPEAKRGRPSKEIPELLSEISSYVSSKCRHVKSCRLNFTEQVAEKTLATSDGAACYSRTPVSRIIISLTGEKAKSAADVFRFLGGPGNWEDVFSSLGPIKEEVDELYEHLLRKTEGVFPESGRKDCILADEVSGILAHEAIGHTVEADIVREGSAAGGMLGRAVASPLVSIVDFAHTAFKGRCPVPLFVDDEGTNCEDVTLIENGILKSYMHNKESAARFAGKPAGNARAATYEDEPIIRMRNTAMLPGASKIEDMIASVKDGYYFLRNGMGQADLTSEFMFAIQIGYEIKNGKLGRALKDTTVSGVGYEVLKTVDMVSDSLTWIQGAMCGKIQAVPAGAGGPSIRCRINVGGR